MEYLAQCGENVKKADDLLRLQQRKAELEQQLCKLTEENRKLHEEIKRSDRSEDWQDLVEIHHRLDVYRLSGVSILPEVSSSAAVTLRFDAVYGNHCPSDDFYTVQLLKEGDKYTLGQCSLPPFVPVKALAKELLYSDVSGFVEHIWNYVYCYVQRREDWKHVQSHYSEYLVKDIEVNFSVTYVNFCLSVGDMEKHLEASLQYKLTDTLPESVEIKLVEDTVEHSAATNGNEDEKVIHEAEQVLQENRTHTAVKCLLELLKVG